MERFVGVLIEHFAGAFPLWLAPEQVRVLPLSDKSLDYAQEVERRFRDAGFRVRMDTRNSKVQAKIRDAQLELVPYMLVLGPKEAEQGAVALRDRIDGDLGTMPTAAAIDRLREEVSSRRIRQVAKSTFQGVDEGQGEQHEY
jgi:threonyl-tRNA synthetase